MINTSLLQSGAIMRVSLILSLFVHVVAILALQEAFPFHWAVEELRTYRVDLIRPPIEDINVDKISKPKISKMEEEEPIPEDSEATISIESRDKKYLGYLQITKQKLISHGRYPREAIEKLIEGKVTVIFTLNRQGNLTQIKTKNSSGFDILDQEVYRRIRAAAPFPTFPDSIKVNKLNIIATIEYQLQAKK